MKLLMLMTFLATSLFAHAESPCDVRVGESIGIKVVEFATGNVVHSKMSLKESSSLAIYEEMMNLQDMGVCSEKIISKKCVLKFEKKIQGHQIVLFRGPDRWQSWSVSSKHEAQDFVRGLKRAGFCS